jgi:hypothetical protein
MQKLTFEKFLVSPLNNSWIKEPGLEIYVRKTKRLDGIQETIDLANMNAARPGKGALTRFLDRYEPDHIFYLENVFETRLKEYYERRGYVTINDMYPWCMLKGRGD